MLTSLAKKAVASAEGTWTVFRMNIGPVLRALGLYGAALVVLLFVLSRNFRYNPTPSVPRGLYALRNLPETPQRGTLVMGCLQGKAAHLARRRGYVRPGGRIGPWTADECPMRLSPVIKRLWAVPGDTATINRKGTFVNGKQVGAAPLTRDSEGRPMAGWYGMLVLGPHEYLLGSDHPRGYDSRYFGPVPRTALSVVARPLWTGD